MTSDERNEPQQQYNNQREPKFTYNVSGRDPAKAMRPQSRSKQAFARERFPGPILMEIILRL